MGYSKDIYDDALEELKARRNKAEYEAISRHSEIVKKLPRIQEIEESLAKTSTMAARAVFADRISVREMLEKLKTQNLALQMELKTILEKNSYPADYLETHYYCKDCNDKGYIDGKMCTCMKKLLREKAYDKLNKVSPLSLSDFKSFSLEYYSKDTIREGDRMVSPYSRMEKILHFCESYAVNFTLSSRSILFQGGSGLGKTHLSLAIAKELIENGYGVIYASAPDILSKLESERFNDDKSTDATENLLKECDLLIIDDLGTEFLTQFTLSKIYNIINTRMLLKKPIIISTNLTLKELEKSYHQRLVSRIIGEMIRLKFIGRDIRQMQYNNTVKKG